MLIKIQRHEQLETDISAHIKDPDSIRRIIHRIIFKPAHIIHIGRIKKVGAGDVYAAGGMSFGNDISADTGAD